MGEVVAWLEAILRGQGPIDLHLGCSTFVVSRSLDVDRILKRERIAVLLVGPARSVVTIHWSVSHCGVLISITLVAEPLYLSQRNLGQVGECLVVRTLREHLQLHPWFQISWQH